MLITTELIASSLFLMSSILTGARCPFSTAGTQTVNINHPFWLAKTCPKRHWNTQNCPYRQGFVVLFGGDVQLSCNVNILHGHKALVLGKGLLHYLNCRGHIVGFVVTPGKCRYEVSGNSHNWQCILWTKAKGCSYFSLVLLISKHFH